METILGVDIGGAKCTVVIGAMNDKQKLHIFDKLSFPTELDKGCDHALTLIFTAIRTLLEADQIDTKDVAAIGISCCGPLDSKTGMILSPPNLPGWDEVPIVELFEKRFGIRTYLQNDANACALAEWKYGAARNKENAIFLTFSTGMGAGMILNGKLYAGKNDMAGEIGHVRMVRLGPVGYGKAGSFEGFCSESGLISLARGKALEKLQMGEKVSYCKDLSQVSKITTKKLKKAALAGDTLALEVYGICGRYMGYAISALIDVLNPEVIVLGGIYGDAQTFIEPEMRKVIEKETLRQSLEVCSIVSAELGDNLGCYAALSVATSQMSL